MTEPKVRASGPLSAALAEQGSGVGVALQLSWATWFATAAFQIDCHVEPAIGCRHDVGGRQQARRRR